MSTQIVGAANASKSRFYHPLVKFFSSPEMAFSLLPVLFSLTLLGIERGNRTYGPSHWFVTYEHGFLRRALIGNLFAHTAFLPMRRILILEALLFALLAAMTVLAFRRILFGTMAERRFAAFLLAAPAFLPHMAYMNGEMDNFLYITVLVGAFLMMRFQNGLGMLLATACCVIGLLIHEAFALMFYPLILALGIDLVHRGKLRWDWFAANVMMVAVAFFAVIHYGKLTGSVDQWIHAAQHRTDMPIEGTVFQVLNGNFFSQIHAVALMYTPKLIFSLLLTLALAIPYGIVLWRMLKTSCRARGYSRLQIRLLLLIFSMPFCLPVLGHDVMRWMSALCINISLFLLFLYRSETRYTLEAADFCEKLTSWTTGATGTATLVYLLAVGPWGYNGNLLLANLAHIFSR